MRFATGKWALATCGRCGMRGRYSEMVDDGQTPGLRVHPACRDIRHPQEKPVRAEDGVALQRPTGNPDTANDPLATAATLINNLPPLTGHSFGGGT